MRGAIVGEVVSQIEQSETNESGTQLRTALYPCPQTPCLFYISYLIRITRVEL